MDETSLESSVPGQLKRFLNGTSREVFGIVSGLETITHGCRRMGCLLYRNEDLREGS